MHVVLAVAFCASLYKPLAHSSHVACPVKLWYLPFAQSKQLTPPPAPYWPASHAMHALLYTLFASSGAALYCPAGQSLQR